MRWWQLALGGALLAWVLGAAYFQARKRGRNVSLALVLLAASVGMFVAAGFFPWSQKAAPSYPSMLIVASIVCLALSMAVVLWRGFHR